MSNLLTELLNAGLIEKLEGDDGRFSKIEQAAITIAQELREQPPQLIRAILAGLDPDIDEDDPIIVIAEQALVAEWKAVRSVFPDMPVNILRTILLDACNQVAEEENNASILWLTAADTFPFLRLGREEAVVRQLLESWAKCAEEKALVGHDLTIDEADQDFGVDLKFPKTTALESPKVDRAALLTKIAGAAGPNNQQNQALTNANPHWPNSASSWSWEFAPRMQTLLADELDILADKFHKSQLVGIKEVQTYMAKLTQAVNESLVTQQRKVQEIRQAEQIRLNSLWWSEALYSTTLSCSYRELDPAIATVVMTVDLLNEVDHPTTASVGYLLTEAVNRLPVADFSKKLTLQALLETLGKLRGRLDSEWLKTLDAPPETGRLSLRDGVVLVLTGKAKDVISTLKRMGASDEYEMSLPQFAHAFFRQEQAVQLAGALHE
jgi:hypothetical protein